MNAATIEQADADEVAAARAAGALEQPGHVGTCEIARRSPPSPKVVTSENGATARATSAEASPQFSMTSRRRTIQLTAALSRVLVDLVRRATPEGLVAVELAHQHVTDGHIDALVCNGLLDIPTTAKLVRSPDEIVVDVSPYRRALEVGDRVALEAPARLEVDAGALGKLAAELAKAGSFPSSQHLIEVFGAARAVVESSNTPLRKGP